QSEGQEPSKQQKDDKKQEEKNKQSDTATPCLYKLDGHILYMNNAAHSAYLNEGLPKEFGGVTEVRVGEEVFIKPHETKKDGKKKQQFCDISLEEHTTAINDFSKSSPTIK